MESSGSETQLQKKIDRQREEERHRFVASKALHMWTGAGLFAPSGPPTKKQLAI